MTGHDQLIFTEAKAVFLWFEYGLPSCAITLVKTPETCKPVLNSIVPKG
jgi:hypothetical protein